MPALPTFAFMGARAGARPRARLGDTLSPDERQTVLDTLSTARNNFGSANLWTNSHDIEEQFGVNAPVFQQMLDSGAQLDQRLFDVEGALRSDNPADWNVSADDISMIQKLANTDDQLWGMIEKGRPVGLQPSPDNPDMFFLPPEEPTLPLQPEGPTFGLPDLLKLVAAGGAIASPFLKFLQPGTKPSAAPAPVPAAPSTGMPWWGWALLGLGGAGVGFFFLRKIF